MPASSQSPERASGASGAPPGLAPRLRWRRVFPGEECQVGELRRWLASLLPPCPARDDVAAVASELGANAVKHTFSGRGGCFAVEVTWYGNVVRVAVADSGGPAEPHVIDDPAGENGRGLLLVRGLSVRTGVCGDRRGRLSWADVAWGDPLTATVAAPDGWEAVTAPTAGELAGLLYRLLGTPTPQQADAAHAHQDAAKGDAARRHPRTSDPRWGRATSPPRPGNLPWAVAALGPVPGDLAVASRSPRRPRLAPSAPGNL